MPQIAIRETIKVNNVDPIGHSELNQTQATGVRVKFRGFRIKTNSMLVEELIDSAAEFLVCSDELIRRIHYQIDLATKQRKKHKSKCSLSIGRTAAEGDLP